jgi:hypothetical protein
MSVAAAYEKNLRLPFINIFYCGIPKLWTVVNFSLKNDFLNRVIK